MRLNFVGDIGLFKSYEYHSIDPIEEIELPRSDVNVGNFEFIGHDDSMKKAFYYVQTHYFPSTEYVKRCQLNKFDYLSLANNHILDFGSQAVRKNIEILNNKGIKCFGFSCTAGYNSATIKKDDIEIALIGCIGQGRWSKKLNNGCGPDDLNMSSLKAFINEIRGKVDHIIIFPHWGSELVDIPKPRDIKIAHELIEFGASAVIGTHSHIIQGVESYQTGVVAYGLGSFIYRPEEEFGYIRNRKRNYSICLSLELTKKDVKSFQSHYYLLDENCIPKLVENPLESEIKYFKYLNQNIYNKHAFFRKKYTSLLIREFYSLLLRFKVNPKSAFYHYIKYFKRKIFNFI